MGVQGEKHKTRVGAVARVQRRDKARFGGFGARGTVGLAEFLGAERAIDQSSAAEAQACMPGLRPPLASLSCFSIVSFTASGIRLGCRPQARNASSMRCTSWDRPKIPNRPSMMDAARPAMPRIAAFGEGPVS